MEFDILKSIANRRTTRTFEERAISFETKFKLNYFLQENNCGPFGTKIYFHLLDLTTASPLEIKKYGSFGLVIPGGYFIVGSGPPTEFYLEDYGYLMEIIVLYLNHLGIASSWISNHFNPSYFKATLKLQDNKLIPAIITLGFSTKKSSLLEKAIRLFFKANSRKLFQQLFFEQDFLTPINCHGKNKYLLALDMVRCAPSYRNWQPWRIVKDMKEKKFHFYLQHSSSNSTFNLIDIQRLDIGIAMSHFAESMKQLTYSGSFCFQNPMIKLPNKKIEYKATWSC